VASVRDAGANAGKPPTHHVSISSKTNYSFTLNYPCTSSWLVLSYLTRSFNDGRLIHIADSLHKSTLCMVCYSSCFIFHPTEQLRVTTGLASCICICIADEKTQMQMQGDWACPYNNNYTLTNVLSVTCRPFGIWNAILQSLFTISPSLMAGSVKIYMITFVVL
jgi:hypothetical protein